MSNKDRFLRGVCGLVAFSALVWPAAAEPQPAASAPPPPRAGEPPVELRELKAELRAGILAASLPDIKTFREELLALEKKLASAADFEGALRARNERTKLEGKIAGLEREASMLASRSLRSSNSRLAPRIEFKLSDAKLTSAKFDSKRGAISGWDQVNASATWQLPFLPAGGYEVLLRCTGGPGEVVVKEGFYSLTGACKGTDDKSIEQNLGTLRIRAGGGTLTLAVAHPENCADWRVFSLVLVPPSS